MAIATPALLSPAHRVITDNIQESKIREYKATAENRLFYADTLPPIVATALSAVTISTLYFVFHWPVTSISMAVGVVALVGFVAMQVFLDPILESLRNSSKENSKKAATSKALKTAIEQNFKKTLGTLVEEAREQYPDDINLPVGFLEGLDQQEVATTPANQEKGSVLATVLAYYKQAETFFEEEGKALQQKACVLFRPQTREERVDPMEKAHWQVKDLEALAKQHCLFLEKGLELAFARALLARPLFAGSLTPDLGSEPNYQPVLRLMLTNYHPRGDFKLLDLKNGSEMFAPPISEGQLCENSTQPFTDGWHKGVTAQLIHAMDALTRTQEEERT